MKAILDGDIIAYRLAFRAEAEGLEDIELWAEHAISSWTPPNVTEVLIAFSCPRSKNFRRKIWELYKAHRDTGSHAPDCRLEVEQIVKNTCNKFVVGNQIEADDFMGDSEVDDEEEEYWEDVSNDDSMPLDMEERFYP